MNLIRYLLLLIFICLSYLSANQNDFNPYEVLGLSRTATDKDIRQAYKKLAKYWHPDKNSEPNAQEQFTKVNAAYEVDVLFFSFCFLSIVEINSHRFRYFRIRQNDRIMMNTEQHLRIAIEDLIRIIFEILLKCFMLISFKIFQQERRKSFKHSKFLLFRKEKRRTFSIRSEFLQNILPNSNKNPYLIFGSTRFCFHCRRPSTIFRSLEKQFNDAGNILI